MSEGTYQELLGILRKVRKKEKTFAITKGTAISISVLLGLSIPLFLLDNFVHFNSLLRWTCFFIILGPCIFVALKEIILPFLLVHTDEWVARSIEKKYPQLNNLVINSFLLGREESLVGMPVRVSEFGAFLVQESLQKLNSFDLSVVFKWEKARKAAIIVTILVSTLFVYGLFFPRYFSNAFLRIFLPSSPVTFISKTKVAVTPGDTTILRGCDLKIETRLAGEIPDVAVLHWKAEGNSWKSSQMNPKGSGEFNLTLEKLDRPLSYRVKAGDGVSSTHKVWVVDAPVIQLYEFTYRYPEYTHLSSKTLTQKSGDVELLYGSSVKLGGITNNSLRKGKLKIEKTEYPFTVSGNQLKSPELIVKGDIRYSLWLEDENGFISDCVQQGSIKAVADKPPQIQVVLPGQNIVIGSFERIPVLVNFRDDYGIKKVCIKYKNAEGKEKIFKAVAYPNLPPVTTLQTWISQEEVKMKPEDVVTYWVEAEDGNTLTGPGRSISAFLTIRLVDPFNKLQESMRRLASGDAITLQQLQGIFSDITAVLKEILRRQKEIRNETSDKAPASKMSSLAIQEENLRIKTIECQENFKLIAKKAQGMFEIVQLCIKFSSQMEELKIADLMSEAVRYLGNKVVYFAQGKEDEIIDKLNLILQPLEEINRKWTKKETMDKTEAAKKLINSLERFDVKQRDVVSVLEKLSKKPAEDYNSEDVKKLQKMGDVEEYLGKDLSRGTNDFMRVAEKDLGAGVILNTLEEIIAHVKRAEGEFKKITITLDEKEMWKYIALSEQLVEDLQMWLMNKPDIIQWNVQNPLQDYDVPMPDLPQELQDFISDLIQTEEEMDEAVDNIMTGGWLDNIGQAGWMVADGPISNFSAKGKTGNQLPGNQELTGRSGEGRTGKSSGQFVEGQYKGLEGRKIPPRLSDERIQKGVVQEQRHRPNLGSTGGGKISGWGAEGLTDNVPPQVKEEFRRLALREADVIAKASEIKDKLNPYLFVTSKLRENITLMKDIEKDLKEGRYKDAVDKRRLLSDKLLELKSSAEEEFELRREPAFRMDKNIRSKIVDSLKEEYPKEYEELIKEYFEVLSHEFK